MRVLRRARGDVRQSPRALELTKARQTTAGAQVSRRREGTREEKSRQRRRRKEGERVMSTSAATRSDPSTARLQMRPPRGARSPLMLKSGGCVHWQKGERELMGSSSVYGEGVQEEKGKKGEGKGKEKGEESRQRSGAITACVR